MAGYIVHGIAELDTTEQLNDNKTFIEKFTFH